MSAGVVGLFGKICPLPTAILEQLLIFLGRRWRFANELWACLKAKSLTPGLLQAEWKRGTKFIMGGAPGGAGEAERIPSASSVSWGGVWVWLDPVIYSIVVICITLFIEIILKQSC